MEMDASKYYKISDIYFYKTISTILSTQTIYLSISLDSGS